MPAADRKAYDSGPDHRHPYMFETRNGTPFSTRYQDIYFSCEHGLEESRYVFIEGNAIGRRWKAQPVYVIAETGFGTGLNFLATWDCWLKDAQRPDVLHYISVEKYPLTKADLATSHRLFPDLAALSSQLIAKYPGADPAGYPGFYRIWLDHNRVCLTLCFMDVCAAFKELDAVVDSWYLDGFAPAKNPDMWSKNVFRHLARLGRKGTSIATFTAAGDVRRGLGDAGFEVKKIAGYGRKREMIVGTLETVPKIRTIDPWRKFPMPPLQKNSVTVIGAGIAGAQVAWHLAQRGVKVTVLEQHSTVATGASGNPRGIIAPKLAAQSCPEETFSVSGFLYTLTQFQTLGLEQENYWSPCGVLSLANNERKRAQWHAVRDRQLPDSLAQAIDPRQASRIAGVTLTYSALYYPAGGWLVPEELIKNLLAHPNISLQCDTRVTSLEHREDGWKIVIDNDESRLTEAVVLANGSNISKLSPADFPVDLIAGQTTLAQSSTESANLRCVLQHDGYITPARNNRHLIGASYDKNAQNPLPNQQLDLQNLHRQQQSIPEITSGLHALETAHTGTRVATPTRYPIIGTLPNPDFFAGSTSDVKNDRTNMHPLYPGLFISGAFGSRGLTTSALAAEILCCEILGEPAPVPLSLKSAIEPVRWFARG